MKGFACKFFRLLANRLTLTVFIATFVIGFCAEFFPAIFGIKKNIYTSNARIQMQAKNQGELRLITSQEFLKSVVSDLDLTQIWSRRRGLKEGKEITKYEACQVLSGRLLLLPVKNSNPPQTDIYCDADTAREAALIANTVAESFRDLERQKGIQVLIVDRASPMLQPTKQHISSFGIRMGKALCWATLYGAIAVVVVSFGRNQKLAPPTIPSQHPVDRV